jgi:hypothetical protein
MRVEVNPKTALAEPGSAPTVTLSVFNTTSVIDGVSARVLGLDPSWCTFEPPMLALFPDTSGEIELTLAVPADFPAGVHHLSIEVTSVHEDAPTIVRLELEVATVVLPELHIEPVRLTGRRNAIGKLVMENAGNGTIRVALMGSDADRTLRFGLEPAVVDIPPGGLTTTFTVKAPLRIYGAATDKPFTIRGLPRAFGNRTEDLEELSATGTFHHRPVLPRGLATAGLLAGIVGLWALIFVFVLGRILTDEVAGKAAPASYFATSSEVLAAGGGANDPDLPIGAARIDAGARGSIGGTLTSASTDEPVGRVTVEAVRLAKTGPVVASAAATDDTGIFELGGLPPGKYALRYTAPGFVEQWYPSSSGLDGADTVTVGAGDLVDGLDAMVTGVPGSITGTVDAGSATTTAITVQVRALIGGVPTPVIREVRADSTGQYTVPALPTPGTYELTVVAGKFRPATLVTKLAGGENRLESTIQLSAGTGSVGGLVTDDAGNPLGGVTISVTSGTEELKTATPTSGPVGIYQLNQLPTPGTYLISFTAEGLSTEILAVDLGPGEARSDLNVTMSRGTGSIAGQVVDDAGNPVGDVDVTINGPTGSVTTTTLTSGGVGRYGVSGLPTPGHFTVTFRKDGYETTTVDVDLARTGSAPNTNATMASKSAVLRGTISGPGGALGGASITVTDGTTERATVSASGSGDYALVGLPPGSYTITVRATGMTTQTVRVEVGAGGTVTRDITLVAAPP